MFLDPLTNARLEWLLDNEPELVSSLLQSNNLSQLEEMLESKVVEAVRYAELLQGQGREKQEALDLASELILTPADGRDMSDNPPKPLPDRVRKDKYLLYWNKKRLARFFANPENTKQFSKLLG